MAFASVMLRPTMLWPVMLWAMMLWAAMIWAAVSGTVVRRLIGTTPGPTGATWLRRTGTARTIRLSAFGLLNTSPLHELLLPAFPFHAFLFHACTFQTFTGLGLGRFSPLTVLGLDSLHLLSHLRLESLDLLTCFGLSTLDQLSGFRFRPFCPLRRLGDRSFGHFLGDLSFLPGLLSY